MTFPDIYSHNVRVTSYGEFLVLMQCCKEEHQMELMETLSHAKKPDFICGKEVMPNLNMLSYGKLDDLSRIGSTDDPGAKVLDILLDIDPVDAYEVNVFDVFGFLNFVKEEVLRINTLFSNIKVSHTSEEIAAGIENLNFGTFGVVDWYARRMGITNHDDVYAIPWIRIYTCMKNDNEKSEFESRLHKQYMNKIKRK